MARLILRSSIFPGGELIIMPEDLPVTIGRSRRADVVIPDSLLSRVHAEIRRNSVGRFEIVDNESTNLTIVNDQDIDSAELRTGDRILLGETEIAVIVDDAPVSLHDRTTRELPTIQRGDTTEADSDNQSTT
jgi:pSer/pThr/pTyr-binding forkhead associated (FHA) protein